MDAAARPLQDAAQQELRSCIRLLIDAWPDFPPPNAQEEKREARYVADFLKALGEKEACRLFDLRKEDFDYLTLDGSGKWQDYCLNRIRSKMVVHIRAAVEALDAFQRYGYWRDVKPDGEEESEEDLSLNDMRSALRSMSNWLGRYSEANARHLRPFILDRTLPYGEVTTIDTELFTACFVIDRGEHMDDEMRNAAEEIVVRTLYQNLYGMAFSNITDPANLWWAVRIAVGNPRIRSRLPGQAGDDLGKALGLVDRALLKLVEPLPTKNWHPLDYTPEIYVDLRTHGLIMLNLLSIQDWCAENPAFRRNRQHWYILKQTDALIGSCWEGMTENGKIGDSLVQKNLYLVSLVNRCIVHWLAQARTASRWELLKGSYHLTADAQGRLTCAKLIRELQKKTGFGVLDEKYATANKAYCDALIQLHNKLSGFVRAKSARHPFVVAICGPPGAGKSYLAAWLLRSLSQNSNAEVRTLNLTTFNWQEGKEEWIKVFDGKRFRGELKVDGDAPIPFQGAVIDEADAVRLATTGNGDTAYQWLLQPLWETWPGMTGDPKKEEPMPTIVFVIASRYWRWNDWYRRAMDAYKGGDFVSRVDAYIDLPPLTPEDQLLLFAIQLPAEISNLHETVAKGIACGQFESHARGVEALKKQCALREAREVGCLNSEHFRGAENFISHADQ